MGRRRQGCQRGAACRDACISRRYTCRKGAGWCAREVGGYIQLQTSLGSSRHSFTYITLLGCGTTGYVLKVRVSPPVGAHNEVALKWMYHNPREAANQRRVQDLCRHILPVLAWGNFSQERAMGLQELFGRRTMQRALNLCAGGPRVGREGYLRNWRGKGGVSLIVTPAEEGSLDRLSLRELRGHREEIVRAVSQTHACLTAAGWSHGDLYMRNVLYHHTPTQRLSIRVGDWGKASSSPTSLRDQGALDRFVRSLP